MAKKGPFKNLLSAFLGNKIVTCISRGYCILFVFNLLFNCKFCESVHFNKVLHRIEPLTWKFLAVAYYITFSTVSDSV